jgi:Pentapeptide repeats (8 copies)
LDIHELRRQYREGKRDFSFADLQGVNCAGENLSNISLAQANLDHAILVNADLSQANLRQARLCGANLAGANLRQANLRRANLKQAILDGACLEGAALTGAIMPDGNVYSPPKLASRSVEQPNADAVEADSTMVTPDASEHSLPSVLPSSVRSHPKNKHFSTWQDFHTHLPWPLLAAWAMGFVLIGLLLGWRNATFLEWLIVWLISISWIISETMVGFIPLLVSLVVILRDGLSLSAFTAGGLAAVVLFVVLSQL